MLDKCRIPLYKHQIIGVEKIVNCEKCFALFDEMGAGKTKQVIDAAQVLYDQGKILVVIVVAPACVRSGVWYNPEFGELAKHLWIDTPSLVAEYHRKERSWTNKESDTYLTWIITNYEFIRADERLEFLKRLATEKTLLILDESSAVKTYNSKQTKACLKLRNMCGKVILLNGTPIANSPGDIYAQANIMNPSILSCKSWFHFRARYAIMGGWKNKQVVGWRHKYFPGCCTSREDSSVHNNERLGIEDIQSRMAPYVLRRLKKDCIDLPAKLSPVTLEVTLKSDTWTIYKQLRDDLIAWLNTQTAIVAPQSGVRIMRLAQITSGFIGGIQVDYEETQEQKSIGDEKRKFILEWIHEQLQADKNLKLLIWCRFRYELELLYKELLGQIEHIGKLWGSQGKAEREACLRLLKPGLAPEGSTVVLGVPATGSVGIDLSAAHTVVYMSNDYNLKTRLQSEDRVHRPGQIYPVSYYDIVAVGPDGQKTIDSIIIQALRQKENIATWTCSAWVKKLLEDE